MTNKANITVHVLNFHDVFSHIEIVLENTSTNPSTYYAINRWESPKRSWGEYISKEADSVHSFRITADPDEITEKWKKYYNSTYNTASILGENCAVAAQRFLTHFANIPEPSLSNISWNNLVLGIMWPSFIPCPVTLPGRIMDNVKFHTKNPIFSCQSIDELPDNHENQHLKDTINFLKDVNKTKLNDSTLSEIAITRLKTLTEFYGCLSDLSIEADVLQKSGYRDEADCAKQLVNNLKVSAKSYLIDPRSDAFDKFKSNCKTHIQTVTPILEIHHGWKRLLNNLALVIVGACVASLITAGCKATAENLRLLYNEKRPRDKKLNALSKSLSLAKAKNKAINTNSLSNINRFKSKNHGTGNKRI